jgi:hypothetical protein
MKVKFSPDPHPKPVQYQDLQPGDPFIVADRGLPILSSLEVYMKVSTAIGSTGNAVKVHTGYLYVFDVDREVYPLDATMVIERIQSG